MPDDEHSLNEPYFSVLVANHNHGGYVAAAIDSVLAQTWPAARREVIVVDDGSTDDSRERLAAYAGRDGVVVVEQPNRGQTSAFAAGLKHARGNVICLLDSDDSCLPHKLAALAAHIAALDVAGDSLFLCHDLLVVDARTGEPFAETWFDVVNIKRLGPLMQVGTVHHSFPFAVSSGMVFGRPLLEDVMSRVPAWEWRHSADNLLGQTALMICGEVHYVQQPLGSYRVHERNNFAAVEQGRFRPKPMSDQRWPRILRFLELLLDSLPLSPLERAGRAAYLGQVEHSAKAIPQGRRHAQPLLSFVVDATGAAAPWSGETVSAIVAQSQAHHETIWVCTPATRAHLPAGAGTVVEQGAGGGYAVMRAGLAAARGGYLCFLEAGDQPERRFVERHLQAHRFGNLPMLTACDLRLLDADGAVLHAGIQGTAAGWGSAVPAPVAAFAQLLGDWQLAPLPACVLRRSPLLEAFFAPEAAPVPERHVGWLLSQYLVQMGGATRLAENLMDLRLPAHATPNPSWLAMFIDRHGPIPAPNLPACCEALFAAYARAAAAQRAFFSGGWEGRFVRWLLQSGGGDTAARIERVLHATADAALLARVGVVLRGVGGSTDAAGAGKPR